MSLSLFNSSQPFDILLVDDNRGDAALFARALKEETPQARLTALPTGEDALAFLAAEAQFAQRRLPDLILLDLGLPRIGGLDVLKAIKAHVDWKHIPVVVMSNSGSEDNVRACYQHYASAYITKPADIHQFRTTTASMVKFYFHLARLASADV